VFKRVWREVAGCVFEGLRDVDAEGNEVEHSQVLKNTTDEQLEAAIAAVREVLEERAPRGFRGAFRSGQRWRPAGMA